MAASLKEARYAPLKVAVRKVESKEPRIRIEEDYPEDDGAPVGPSEAEEAGYLAETTRESGVTSQPVDEDLPKLEELTRAISPQIMKQLDELFRAQFSRVQRVDEKDLKS